MTQSERRQGGQQKQTTIGSLLTIALLLIVFLARNYLATPDKVSPSKSPTTAATEISLAKTSASEGSASNTTQGTGEVKIVIEDDASVETQQSNQPDSESAAVPVAKKKATRTPTPKPRNTSIPTRTAKATATHTPTTNRAPPTKTSTPTAVKSQSGLPIVYFDDLPREAQQTIRLIDKGGPFPYSRDGIEFQNRERLLPRKPRGYYAEYTVITPGSNDRGARRIIEGEDGELYYTDDHYDSFKEVIR